MFTWLDVYVWHRSDSGNQRQMALSPSVYVCRHDSLVYVYVTGCVCVTWLGFWEAQQMLLKARPERLAWRTRICVCSLMCMCNMTENLAKRGIWYRRGRLGLQGCHGSLAYVSVTRCARVTWLRFRETAAYGFVREGSGCGLTWLTRI